MLNVIHKFRMKRKLERMIQTAMKSVTPEQCKSILQKLNERREELIKEGKLCLYCGGNGRVMPCAYPKQNKPGCLFPRSQTS